jgi:hypothetical protein
MLWSVAVPAGCVEENVVLSDVATLADGNVTVAP